MLNGKVAIFGGSFDPIHFGHQAVCFWLKDVLNCNSIELVPTYQHIFGKHLESFENRLHMCYLAAQNMREYVHVSDVEIRLPIPNTTYNLLDYFKTLYGSFASLVCVIGSDCLADIIKWHKWDKLSSLAEILVVDRPGNENIVAPFPVLRYPLNITPTSSSVVREAIKEGKSIEGLVSHQVADYIYKNKLYEVK